MPKSIDDVNIFDEPESIKKVFFTARIPWTAIPWA
jgi:hypothetical protein